MFYVYRQWLRWLHERKSFKAPVVKTALRRQTTIFAQAMSKTYRSSFFFWCLTFGLLGNSFRVQAQQEFAVLPDSILSVCLRNINESVIVTSPLAFKSHLLDQSADCPGSNYIDFDQKILVGYPVKTGGCREPSCTGFLKRSVQGDTLWVTPRVNGLCRPLWHKTFWFVLDKPMNQADIFLALRPRQFK
jgi:hypothetical protein